jgi:regulator of sigma D
MNELNVKILLQGFCTRYGRQLSEEELEKVCQRYIDYEIGHLQMDEVTVELLLQTYQSLFNKRCQGDHLSQVTRACKGASRKIFEFDDQEVLESVHVQ